MTESFTVDSLDVKSIDGGYSISGELDHGGIIETINTTVTIQAVTVNGAEVDVDGQLQIPSAVTVTISEPDGKVIADIEVEA